MIFGVSVYFFYFNFVDKAAVVQIESNQKTNESVSPVSTYSQANITADDQSLSNKREPVETRNIVHKVEVQQKIDKAINNLKVGTRRPTGQIKLAPEFLKDHEAFDGTQWKIMSKVKTILRDEVSTDDIVIGEMGRYKLVELSDGESSLKQFNRNAPTVLFDARLKKTGLVTGLIKVETERRDLLEDSIRSLNATIANSFDSIQTYFITSEKSVFDLEQLFFKIKSLGFVKTAELDILDREYEKK